MSQLWKRDQNLLLASGSVTRLNLLRSASIPVDSETPDVDERAIEEGLRVDQLGPDLVALELASAKGAQVSHRFPGRLVVAADQTLALGSEAFHKPKSIADARAQLERLAGKTHALHSGVVCFEDGRRLFAHVESAHLTMRAFGSAFLDAYLAEAGESVLKSVGGYQVEGVGVHLFERIEGDHSTILGLPLTPLLAFLREARAVEA